MVRCERLGFDIITELDTHRVVFYCAKNFINLANLLLVFQVNWCIKVGDISQCTLANDFILAGMTKEAQLLNLHRNTKKLMQLKNLTKTLVYNILQILVVHSLLLRTHLFHRHLVLCHQSHHLLVPQIHHLHL